MANTTDCPGTLNCPALPRVSLDQAVIDLLESIALQESALSHILCAESQKMKTAMGMEELDLYGTVDACVCLLDSVNHVTEPDRLQQALRRVWLFLEAGGLFVFDVHTPEHLQSLDGGLFLDETDDAYCVWRTEYDPEEAICTYGMDVFQREGEAWYRSTEVHEERAYSIETLTEALRQAGFLDIHTYGDRRLDAPQAGEARVFFTARKPEEAIEHMR